MSNVIRWPIAPQMSTIAQPQGDAPAQALAPDRHNVVVMPVVAYESRVPASRMSGDEGMLIPIAAIRAMLRGQRVPRRKRHKQDEMARRAAERLDAIGKWPKG